MYVTANVPLEACRAEALQPHPPAAWDPGAQAVRKGTPAASQVQCFSQPKSPAWDACPVQRQALACLEREHAQAFGEGVHHTH